MGTHDADRAGHSPGGTIRVYDADNHLFGPGSGPSSPAEYETAQPIVHLGVPLVIKGASC